MNDFLPAVIALIVLGAVFLYGYFIDPYQPQTIAVQPAHGEANRPSNGSLQHSKIG